MSSGGSSSTTTSSPPSQYLDAYSDVVSKAQSAASTPYSQYSGQTVAGFSPDQTAGFSAIENAGSIYEPYLNTAQQYTSAASGANNGILNATQAGTSGIYNATDAGVKGITSAGNTFNPNSISQFESPYTQDVVNTTQNQFNEQNAQAQQSTTSDAIKAGAWGGDRSAVASGILAGQQQTAQAPVIANLENTGYTNATQAAETQGSQAITAATAAANAGITGTTAASSAGITGTTNNANANLQSGQLTANIGQLAYEDALTYGTDLIGIGNQQQSQAQSELDVPYEQWTAEQQWPFQTTSWLSNIVNGVSSNVGGTSTTTSSGGNTGSSTIGALTSGVGLLGSTGAFGSNGYLTGSNGLFGSGSASSSSDVSSAVNSDESIFGQQVTGEYARGGLIPERRAYGGILRRGTDDDGDWTDRIMRQWQPSRRHGGIIPRRASGGVTSGTPGFSTGPTQSAVVPYGAQVPDVSISLIPGASGLSTGTGSGGKSSLMSNVTTQSGGGASAGSQAASAIGTVASIASIAAALARGGIVPTERRRPGRFAAGGTPTVGIIGGTPQLSTGSNTTTGSSGGTNGPTVSVIGGVPQLSTGTSSGTSSGTGTSALDSYLAQERAGESHTSPASAPTTATTATPVSSAQANEVVPVSSPWGGESGQETGGNSAEAGSAGGGSTSSEVESASGGGSDTESDWRGGIVGRKRARGGIIRHLADGGDAPDDETSTDVGDDSDASPALADVLRRLHSGQTVGDVGGTVNDTTASTPSTSTTDSGTRSPPTAPDQDTGSTQQDRQPPPGITGGQPGARRGTGMFGGDPRWDLLTQIGLGIMGGTSSNAAANIGQGALKGIQAYNQQNYRQQQLEALGNWRTGQLNLGQQKLSALTDYRGRVLQLKAAGLDDLSANRQAMQELAAQRQTETARHDQATEGTRQQNADTNAQRTSDAFTNRTARLQLAQQEAARRQTATQALITQRGITNDRNAQKDAASLIGRMSSDAIRIYVNSKDPYTGKYSMTPEQAQQQADKFHDGAARSAPPSTTPSATTGNDSTTPAPQSGSGSSSLAPPKVGDVMGGYRYKGGDPSDSSSWEASTQ